VNKDGRGTIRDLGNGLILRRAVESDAEALAAFNSVEDLQYAFVDCRIDIDQARVLLTILFPRQASNLWPVA
jgi:hypothetical protein